MNVKLSLRHILNITIFKIKCNVLFVSILYSHNLNQMFYYTTAHFLFYFTYLLLLKRQL